MCSSVEKIERRPTSPNELIMELRSAHPPSLHGRAGCETWSVDFSPDGSVFAWSMGHGIVLLVAWPLDSAKNLWDRQDRTITCGQTVWGLALGPRPPKGASAIAKGVSCDRSSGLLLATGLDSGVIMIWSVANGRHLYDLRGHDSIVRDLVFPPNGQLTLISSSRDKTLRIWDLNQKGKKVRVLSGHKDWISCCCVSPDCSMIASVGRFDRMVCLWSLRSYTFIRSLNNFFKTFFLLVSCDFSPDGALLATAAFGGTSWWIDLWDPYTGERLASLVDECNPGQNQISALQFSPDGLHLAMVTDRAVRVWEPGQEDMLLHSRGDHATNGLCCSFHPQGGVVATGTRDGHVRFWKVPRAVPCLAHLCRSALRLSVSTHQVQALRIPPRILDFLTYKNIPDVNFDSPRWG